MQRARLFAFVFPLLSASAAAQVVLIESGHTLTKLVDSTNPIHPSQALLESTLPTGSIESVGVDPATGDAYVQLIAPGASFISTTTHVFKVSKSGVVTPVAVDTHLGANGRGTDLAFDSVHGFLVTEDQRSVPPRIATIDPVSGAIGTYSGVAPGLLWSATFGMDFSKGVGGTVVPFNDIVFATDLGGGINSATYGGSTSTTRIPGPALPDVGDDLVIQPDGDWVWVGDFYGGIIAWDPAPPYQGTSGGLNLQAMFESAGLAFVHGSRGSGCSSSGEIYVSYSGGPGGSGIFRVNESLTTATLLVKVGNGVSSGVHDLAVGPSTVGSGSSLFFTVHDSLAGGSGGGEQVWELSLPECVTPECFLLFGEARGAAAWGDGGHVWTTLLAGITTSYPVTMEKGPSFPIEIASDWLRRARIQDPPIGDELSAVPWDRFTVQVLLWNPIAYPSRPEQYSPALEVTIWPSGAVSAIPYGAGNGMTIGVEIVTDGEERSMRFPFHIHTPSAADDPAGATAPGGDAPLHSGSSAGR